MEQPRTLICQGGHEHSVQPWGTVPPRCMFTPCSLPFLSPAQVGALTRKLNREASMSL